MGEQIKDNGNNWKLGNHHACGIWFERPKKWIMVSWDRILLEKQMNRITRTPRTGVEEWGLRWGELVRTSSELVRTYLIPHEYTHSHIFLFTLSTKPGSLFWRESKTERPWWGFQVQCRAQFSERKKTEE